MFVFLRAMPSLPFNYFRLLGTSVWMVCRQINIVPSRLGSNVKFIGYKTKF